MAKLEIEGRWSHTLLNVRLPAIDFVVWLNLKNMLSIKVDEEEILVGKIVWGDRKLEDSIDKFRWLIFKKVGIKVT